MENINFKSFVVKENADGTFSASFQNKSISDLPEGDLVIKVHYSALNYKDALVYRGHKGIARSYPFTPGIDAAGVVVHSICDKYKIGDKVLVTGYDLGMNTSGAYQEYIRVPSEWIVPLPENLSMKEAMVLGTAGFTSAIAIHRLQLNGVLPENGKILVTGATGGVGVCSLAILHKIGYEIIASSGKPEYWDFLKEIGANEVVDRKDILDNSKRPLLARRWKGVIENVGGETLTSVAKATEKEGAIAVIGILAGDTITTTLYPFILRGLALLGIESAETDYDLRCVLWKKLSNEWRIADFELISREISFEQIPAELEKMLNGTQSKKIVVKISE